MFYRLCSGAPQQLKSKLGITKAEDFLVSLQFTDCLLKSQCLQVYYLVTPSFINPYGNYVCQKHVLKLVKLFSGHCLAIKS